MFQLYDHGSFNNVFAYLNYLKNRKYLDIMENYGQMGVDALASATPVDTGSTASSWHYEIHRSVSTSTIEWHNDNLTKTGIPIVILLQYGHATSIDDMLVNYETSIRDELLIYSIICIIFAILTMVGIGGNNGIQNIINKYDFVVYYMLGATKTTCILIEAVRSGIVIVLSYALAIGIYQLIPTVFPINAYEITLQTWVIILLFLILIYCVTSGIFLYRLSRSNLVTSYKESLKGKL